VRSLAEETKRALDAHAEWVRSPRGSGRQLNRVGLDLEEADLRNAMLHYCLLPEARLQRANLEGADLSAAFLMGQISAVPSSRRRICAKPNSTTARLSKQISVMQT
jgi:uncharacterized protein YjbI with pentapeptide repeats